MVSDSPKQNDNFDAVESINSINIPTLHQVGWRENIVIIVPLV